MNTLEGMFPIYLQDSLSPRLDIFDNIPFECGLRSSGYPNIIIHYSCIL